MEATANVLSMLFISVMSWQDFKTRTITAWLLPAIGFCFLLGEATVLSADLLLSHAKVNCSLLVIQFFMLWLWISARNRKWVNIVDTQIGLGDILLLICLAPAFSPINFLIFYTAGAIFAILVTLIHRKMNHSANERIPLAGLLGLPLLIVCFIRIFSSSVIDLTSDDWILTKMLMP